jgi:hypothetical protein
MRIGCAAMRLLEILTILTTQTINSWDFEDRAKKRMDDFTRNRKMKFEDLICYMIQSLKSSTSAALRRFFAGMGMSVSMAQQSLSEARKKINVSAFVELFELVAGAMTKK